MLKLAQRRIFTAKYSRLLSFKPQESQWLQQFGATVWHEFSPLSVKHNAANLGQGFPNWSPPAFVTEAAQLAAIAKTPDIDPKIGSVINQYARPNGHLRLVSVLSDIYSPLVGQDINPLTEIQITSGASGGLFVAISAMLNPGDEAIVFAPWFDIYEGPIAKAGAKMVQVPLKLRPNPTSSADWYLDMEEFEKSITPNTKLVILNTPHNPTGKVFSYEELEQISDIVKRNNRIVVVTDEVYEWISFGPTFPRICTVPGMWERTLNVSSAGKTFSVTGWKIGWVYGPANLVDAVSRVSQFAWFSVSTPMQEAVAVSFEHALETKYFSELKSTYLKKRDELMGILSKAGLQPILPEGTFFILSNIADFPLEEGEGTQPEYTMTGLHPDRRDWNFCRWLTVKVGVTAIPCSAFYTGTQIRQDLIRFAFCKTDAELEKARNNLAKLSAPQ